MSKMNSQQKFECQENTLYAHKASRYRLLHSLQTLGVDAYWRKRIAKKVIHSGYKLLIEPGTGTGLASAALIRQGFCGEIIGVDLNEQMLAHRSPFLKGKQQYSSINASVLALPYVDNHFDGGFSVVGLGGVFDFEKAFRELVRVIKPGGKFFAIEMCEPRSRVLRWFHRRLIAESIRKMWHFRDLEIEPILKKLKQKDYQVKYRNDLLFGSVFELTLKISKSETASSSF